MRGRPPKPIPVEELFCARCRRPVRLAWRSPSPQDTNRGRTVSTIGKWPEGYICIGCFARAAETYERCTGCGVDRLTPGLSEAGEPLCTDCAGLGRHFTCTRCGQEGWLHYAGVCGRCVLTDRLAETLDDGTGVVRAELIPFYDTFRAMARPRSGICWLAKPHVPPILHALARGEVPLTHEGLSTLSPWRSVIYLRDLLIGCGVLPPIDRYLFLFEQWLPGWLDSIPDPEHRKLLHRYATWDVLRHLREVAATAPVGPYRNINARLQLRRAATFLTHLAEHGRSLHECTQADLDRWFATAINSDKTAIRPFLRWATGQRHMPTLQLPRHVTNTATVISQQERIALIRRIHTGQGMDLLERVVALLILLYAQPLQRILRLTVDDVISDGNHVLLHLGDPPVPVPEPFANLFTSYVASRSNLTTATNPGSRLLFPGRRAGQPLHPNTLRLRLDTLGIPNLSSRTRAIRELLLQAPAPVVASMLGYEPASVEKLAADAGTTWKRYAAGDHTPAPPPAQKID